MSSYNSFPHNELQKAPLRQSGQVGLLFKEMGLSAKVENGNKRVFEHAAFAVGLELFCHLGVILDCDDSLFLFLRESENLDCPKWQIIIVSLDSTIHSAVQYTDILYCIVQRFYSCIYIKILIVVVYS